MNLFRTVVRLRGNDSAWCGEGFVVAHEPLCFSVTGYYVKSVFAGIATTGRHGK